MTSRDGLGGWLEGGPSGDDGPRGARLGLPAEGPGSMATLGRRVLALVIDWAACSAIAYAFFDNASLAAVSVLAVESFLLVSTLGMTLGHRVLGLQVRRVVPATPADAGLLEGRLRPVEGPVGFRAGAIRAVLLCLAIPAVVWDADGRGMHDRLAGTVLVRR